MAQVAATIHQAITDPSVRGRVLEVTGPMMTLNELAASVTGRPGHSAPTARHVPRPVLRLLATAHGTPLGRQAASALVMDSHDMTHQVNVG